MYSIATVQRDVHLQTVVNLVAVAAFLLTSFYIAANKEHLTKRLIIFRCVNSALPQLYYLKFSFKLANICRSYEKKLLGLLFSVHDVSSMTWSHVFLLDTVYICMIVCKSKSSKQSIVYKCYCLALVILLLMYHFVFITCTRTEPTYYLSADHLSSSSSSSSVLDPITAPQHIFLSPFPTRSRTVCCMLFPSPPRYRRAVRTLNTSC